MTIRHAIAAAILIGTTGWLLVWFQTDPRANWDSLIYHKHAFEYAGMSAEAADAASWAVYDRYADDRQRATIIAALDGQDWRAPDRERWMNLYRMRPLYPALVAAAYPVFGTRAPMAVSLGVTIAFVVTLGVGVSLVFGGRVGAIAVLAAVVNPYFRPWIVFLTPDGMAIVLWTAGLVTTAMYARTGRRGWLLGVAGSVLVLAITRPTGTLAPFVPLICCAVAVAARQPVWRRFAAATVAAGIPALAVLLLFLALGMPGIVDVLQENPTRHFALPDVPDPVAHWLTQIRWAVPSRLLPTLLADPLLLGLVLTGLAGLVMARSWTVAPFLAALLVIPVAWLIHPIWYDANRILSPAWVSLSVGLAILVKLGLVANRERLLSAMDQMTRRTVTAEAEP
jgi:hypothetical protein